MKQLRVGIIGLGFIGQLHARIAFEQPEISLETVSDIRPDVAEKFARQFNCQGETDFEKVLENPKIEAVFITVPDPLHEEIAIKALENGKAVLLEKPAAPTANAVERILNAVKKNNGRLMIAHILQFDPRYAQLRDEIQNGKLGEIIHMFFRRTNPRANAKRSGKNASIFHYIGVHDFEMMCCYAQSKPIRTYCRRVMKVNREIPSEDSIFATVDFADGAVAVIELCWALPDNTALGINTYAEVAGTRGAGYVNIFDQGVSIYTESGIQYPDTLHWPEYNGMILGDLKEEIAHFARATLNNQPYIVNNENALMAAKIIDGCFQSIETGLPVNLE